MNTPPPQPPAETPPGRWTALVACGGLAWLVAFSVYFHSRTLPNNAPISRADLWLILPEVLAVHLPGGMDGEIDDGSPTSDESVRSGWRYLPQRGDLLLVGGFILMASLSWGSVILRGLRVAPPGFAEWAALAGGLGLSAWSLFTLASGVCGLMSRWWFGSILCLGILLAAAMCWRDRAKRSDSIPSAAPWWKRRYFAASLLPFWVGIAVAPFLMAMALGSLLPPTDFDVKEYHLGGPKEYYLDGRVMFLPHNVYTSFPFLTEMLSLSAMIVRGDWYRGAMAGQFVLMAFAPLSACAVYALARRLAGTAAGWWAVLIHLTTPWTYRISIIAYAEGGLSFYLIAALLAVVMLRDAETVRRRYALLAGLLAGSAAACKYPGVVQVAIPLSLAALWFCQPRSAPGERGGIIRCGALIAAGVLIAFGPWLVKNTIETGNPVYPLCYRIFGGVDWNEALDAKWREGHAAEVKNLDSWSRIPGDLWRQALDVAAINDWGSPLLWGFAPVALIASSLRRKTWGVWLYVVWLFLAWWGLTHRIDRFWVPMIPVVAVLAGIGASQLSLSMRSLLTSRGLPGWLPGVIVGVPVAALTLFNLAFTTSSLAGNNAYLFDEDQAMEQTMTPSIAAIHEIEFTTEPTILLVGEAAIFDADFALRYNTVFDVSLFETWCAADPDGEGSALLPADEIRERLKQEGITHVFVNWDEVLRYRRTYGYTDFASPDTFASLVEMEVLREMEMPNSVAEWSDVEAHVQQQVLDWSPELRVSGGRGFRHWALYEVE